MPADTTCSTGQFRWPRVGGDLTVLSSLCRRRTAEHSRHNFGRRKAVEPPFLARRSREPRFAPPKRVASGPIAFSTEFRRHHDRPSTAGVAMVHSLGQERGREAFLINPGREPFQDAGIFLIAGNRRTVTIRPKTPPTVGTVAAELADAGSESYPLAAVWVLASPKVDSAGDASESESSQTASPPSGTAVWPRSSGDRKCANR